MKFEDFLMQRDEEQQRRQLHLQEEVAELKVVLEKEQQVNRILECALHGQLVSRSYLSPAIPLQVQMLLTELAMVEEEIIYLEKKVQDLKLLNFREKKHKKELSSHRKQQQQWWHWQRQQTEFQCKLESIKEVWEAEHLPLLTQVRSQRLIKERTSSLESIPDINQIMSCNNSNEKETQRSRSCCNQANLNKSHLNKEDADAPNKLSEELMKTLISIFHTLNQTPIHLDHEPQPIRKFNISCMNSRSFMPKSSNCKIMHSSDHPSKASDPYGILLSIDGTVRDIGSYHKSTQFTRSSLDMGRISLCIAAIGRLRVLMHKLPSVELTLLTHKQKLAFWINIYNACIMNAFLQHGLPTSPDKLLALLNKAAVNVGGMVLNALAIEHFILRHSSDASNEAIDEKEALLRHAYGLDYPEPNITFALCRGSWSSPALRIYSADDVANELEKAKKEYLEASIGISSRKKIYLPKLLYWHMRDFADDIESLLEWVYSQLPRSGMLKRSIMECLNTDSKSPLAKMVEIKPYEAEFRYLLPP